MIVLNGLLAARFRAAARRCVVGRPRGPSPPVIVERSHDAVSLLCDLGEVAIGLRMDAETGSTERVILPASLPDQVPGTASVEMKLDISPEGRGRCQWVENGQSNESCWDPIPTPDDAGRWTLPRMRTIDASILVALHECGRSAAKEGVRYALSRVQLQGKAGAVAASDGRQLLLWKGFEFPFRDSVLVPAIPVFGGRELAGETDVRIGRSEGHIVVTAGPWTIWLTIDSSGRFPDVARVIPAGPMTELRLDPSDAAELASAIPARINCQDGAARVTLHLERQPSARISGAGSLAAPKLLLLRSACTGPTMTLILGGTHLARALALGLRCMESASENGPVVFRDERRTYVVTTIVPDAAQSVSTSPGMATIEPAFDSHHKGVTVPSERNGRPGDDTPADPLDFMAEAEALRDSLAEVGRRATRLVGALRQLQKQRRMLQTAWSSLKSLRLGP